MLLLRKTISKFKISAINVDKFQMEHENTDLDEFLHDDGISGRKKKSKQECIPQQTGCSKAVFIETIFYRGLYGTTVD